MTSGDQYWIPIQTCSLEDFTVQGSLPLASADILWLAMYGRQVGGMHPTGMLSCYRPQGKVMFSQVSVCPQSASWLPSHCSSLLRLGRYASYCNAFLSFESLKFSWHFFYEMQNRDKILEISDCFELTLNVFFSVRCRWSGIYHAALLRR